MKNITIDPDTLNANIETGNRLGDIDLTLNEQGRGLPHGRCAYVGIGGHSGTRSCFKSKQDLIENDRIRRLGICI